MKNIYTLLAALSFTCISTSAQRTLEIVSEAMDASFDHIESAGSLYVAEHHSATLRRYDGTSMTSFTYPMRVGRQLLYVSPHSQNIADYRSSLYLVLSEEGVSFSNVYRFNGTSFSRVNFPGSILSNIVVYQDRLYAVIESAGYAKLYSYNGSTVSAVPGGTFALPENCEIRTGGNYLYVHGWDFLNPTFLMRFDGLTFRSIPDAPNHVAELQNVVEIPETEHAYLKFRVFNSVYFYDGTDLTESFSQPGWSTPPIRWGDEVAFQATLLDPQLFICHDGSCREIEVPTGSILNDSKTIALYRDELYVSLRVGSNDLVYSYDHASFTEFFEFPENATTPSLDVREGLLLMVPNPGTGDKAYEYTGSEFIEIQTPSGEWLHDSRASNTCLHGWRVSYFDEAVKESRWKFAVERPDADCVPPPAGSSTVSVIPSRLSQYDRIEMAAAARNRGWCWNEIIVDWEISPVCPGFPEIPCEDPFISMEFSDAKGKVVFYKLFEKPFDVSLPLQDKQGVTLKMGLVEGDKKSTVVRYDDQLVGKGIESISLDIHPQDDYFYLTVSTDKGVQIPFTLTLRGAKGEALWKQKFTAPIDERIREFVSEPGEYLEFTLDGKSGKGFTIYPNPVAGTLFIDSYQTLIPIRINIRDINGKTILAEREVVPGLNAIDLSGHRPGLYVLTITEGKETERRLIQLQ